MPGERTPRNVPMIPEADIVAFRGSVSNQRSSMSAALIVMSWTRLRWLGRDSFWNRRPSSPRRSRPGTSKDRGSGGTMERMGFTKRASSTMAFPYSS